MATSEKPQWRVGRHYPIHVYEGDEVPVGTFQTVAYAKEAVEAVNVRRTLAAKGIATLMMNGLVIVRTLHEKAAAMADWNKDRALLLDAAHVIEGLMKGASDGQA